VIDEHKAALAAGLQQTALSAFVQGLVSQDVDAALSMSPLLPLLAQNVAVFVIVLHFDGAAA
tara:strand:- start:1 stop:186 length:186 start_codon:yes stop_codon:yes gene_type:complete